MEKKERLLLPASVKPASYEVRLDPNFDEEKFEGHVNISLIHSCTVIDNCSYLELNCKSINVNEARVKFKHDSWDVLDTVSYNEARETLKMELPQEIAPGDPRELHIILSCTGKFRSDLTGLYHASYETDDGVKHRIAATAMEPTYAREVFPCFDEPSMKAEFTLSILVDESFVTVSNMPVEKSETLSSSKKLATLRKSVSMSTYKALSLDSLTSSHSVGLFISDSTDAKQIYDEISYQKGSCILRMVLNKVGDTKFFEGLKLYLRRHQFQCTESDDLWKAWEEVTGESIATSMRVWTKQPGFPVLRVSESRDESGKVTGVRLFQQDFETVDMNTRELVLSPSSGLFKVNADHGSFFRTSYSHELLNRLLEEASKASLSLRDCIGLPCDLKALVAAGVNKTSELLNLNVKFTELDSFYVWEMIDRNLRSIQSVYKFHGPELNEALRKLTSDVIGPKAEELRWTISKDDDENLITFCMAGDENTIPGSLRREVFGIIAAHGGLEELESLISKNSSIEDEKYLVLECLGRAPNAELMK
ncbi:hypothetical protein QWA68_000627 [Fusarium oxysporum]|nr:hypothetical protein QWA68_000627 [Fusarium oxysporum]